MKKIISVLLAILMLVLTSLVPVYAQETENSGYLYEDAFVERYVGDELGDEYRYWKYKEVYYNYDENNQVNWCLVHATASLNAFGMSAYLKFEDFVLVSSNMIYPFDLKYAVYDVEKDSFFDLVDIYEEIPNYEGLIDVLRNLDESVILGDTDKNRVLTVLDATNIQRDVAQIQVLYDEYTDRRDVKGRFSDYNNDGETTILDATAIQRKLAKLD